MHLEALVPATTSNLGPGFDAVGMALELCNRFEVQVVDDPRAAGTEVRGLGAAELQGRQDTPFHLGLRHAAASLGRPLPPLRVVLDNAVPLGSGLGSSSTAICGGLLLGRLVCGGDDDRAVLLQQAAALEGHPDNAAPCLLGGLVVACHDGAATHALSLPIPPTLCCVAVTPALSLSTAQMRAALPAELPLADVVAQGVHATLLGAALAMGRLDLLALATRDRLHEAVRGAHIPGFLAARAAGLQAGALAVPISGAGPTLIALCDGAQDAGDVGAAMVAAFEQSGIGATARTLQPRAAGIVWRAIAP